MRNLPIIFLLLATLVACGKETDKDQIPSVGQETEATTIAEKDDSTGLEQYECTDPVISVWVKDGRSGEQFSIAKESLEAFSDVFIGTALLPQEILEEKLGTNFVITIETEAGTIKIKRRSEVIVYGETMKYVSIQRYNDLVAFVQDYKNNQVSNKE